MIKTINIDGLIRIKCHSFQEFIQLIKTHTNKGYKVIQKDINKKIILCTGEVKEGSFGYKCESTNQLWSCHLSKVKHAIGIYGEQWTRYKNLINPELKLMTEKECKMWRNLFEIDKCEKNVVVFDIQRNKMLDYLNNLL